MSFWLVYFLPGLVFAGHQAIGHFEGVSIPKIIAFRRTLPFWLVYILIIMIGMPLLIVMMVRLLAAKPR